MRDALLPPPSPSTTAAGNVLKAVEETRANRPADGWHANTTTLTRELALPGAPIRILRLDIETWSSEQTTFGLYLDGAVIATYAIPRDARGDDAAEYRAEGLQWATRVIRDSILAPVVEMTGQANRELLALTAARQPEPVQTSVRPARTAAKKAKKATKKGRR